MTNACCFAVMCGIKNPLKVQKRPMYFDATECEKFAEMVSDSTLQLNFKELQLNFKELQLGFAKKKKTINNTNLLRSLLLENTDF